MKKFLISFIIFLGVIVPWDSESSSFTLLNSGDVEKKIELKGSLYEGSARSAFLYPVQANISTYNLNVIFLYNVGKINVEVYSVTGNIIYEANINTDAQEHLSINVSNWCNGVYQIRLVSSTGHFMYGHFEIE